MVIACRWSCLSPPRQCQGCHYTKDRFHNGILEIRVNPLDILRQLHSLPTNIGDSIQAIKKNGKVCPAHGVKKKLYLTIGIQFSCKGSCSSGLVQPFHSNQHRPYPNTLHSSDWLRVFGPLFKMTTMVMLSAMPAS